MGGGAWSDDALDAMDVPALVDRAVAVVPDPFADGEDDAEYWAVVGALRHGGTRPVFDAMVRLASSDDHRLRRLACDVLGQLGTVQGRPFAAETIPILARVGTTEQSPPVLAAAIEAMGHLDRSELVPCVVVHAGHDDGDVRYAVPSALGLLVADWVEPTHPAVTALMVLSTDDDVDVRDWATFALGNQLSVDGPEVRRCLLARLDDVDDDTRAEAVMGLARRHVVGVVDHVHAALTAPVVGRMSVAAAACLGDPTLADPLERLASWWDVDDELLALARRRCAPGRFETTVDVVTRLLVAADARRLDLVVASDRLDDLGEPLVVAERSGRSRVYALDRLMVRAEGSVEEAARLAADDLDRADPDPAPSTEPDPIALPDDLVRAVVAQLRAAIGPFRAPRPAGLVADVRELHRRALQALHTELDASRRRPVIEIDGDGFHDLAGFFEHVGRRLVPDAPWGRNLAAFDDILRGGFGTPEDGFVLRWCRAEVSRARLGDDVMDRLVAIVRAHGPGGDEAEDGVHLELA